MNDKEIFAEAKIGDRVWSISFGWGEITNINTNIANYPLKVDFVNGAPQTYAIDGRFYKSDQNPTLFWDEIKFEIPKRPKRKVKKTLQIAIYKTEYRESGYMLVESTNSNIPKQFNINHPDYITSIPITFEVEE